MAGEPSKTTGQPERRSAAGAQKLLTCALFVVVLTGAFAYVYYNAFTRMTFWDDEGSLMARVKQMVDGRVLYDEIHTFYGPFHYAVQLVIHELLGFPVSHDVTRWTTLVHWLAIASLCAAFAARTTHSVFVAVVVLLQTVLHIDLLTQEPGHPHEQTVLLIAAAVVAGAFFDREGRNRLRLALLGALPAATVLVKINVGVYLLLAVAYSLLLFSPELRLYRLAQAISGVAIVFLPTIVMLSRLADEQWAFRYWAIATTALVAVVLQAGSVQKVQVFKAGDIAPVLAGFLLTWAAILIPIMMRGTSLHAIVRWTVLVPSEWAADYWQEAKIALPALAGAAASLVLCVLYRCRGRLTWVNSRSFTVTLSVLKLVFAVFVFCEGIFGRPSVYWMLGYLAPFLWLLVVPMPDNARNTGFRHQFPRVFLAVTAALQALVAYPVWGSQTRWATFLFVPAGAVMAWDTLGSLLPHLERFKIVRSPVLRRIATPALLLVVLSGYLGLAHFPALEERYNQRFPLGFDGTQRIRARFEDVAAYNWLVNNLRAHSKFFVVVPSMASLYFWTDRDPPLNMVMSRWTLLMPDPKQNEWIQKFEKQPAMCGVVIPNLVHFWRAQDCLQQPIPKYLQQNFKPAFYSGDPSRRGPWADYHIFVREEIPAPMLYNMLLAGERRFDAAEEDVLPLPRGLLNHGRSLTISGWFKTRSHGVIVGMQSARYPYTMHDLPKSADYVYLPIIYIDSAGLLRVPLLPGSDNAAGNVPVNDGRRHHVTLVLNHRKKALQVFVNGNLVVAKKGSVRLDPLNYAQVGAGFTKDTGTRQFPGTNGDWFHFSGTLRDWLCVDRPMSPGEVELVYEKGKDSSPNPAPAHE